MYSLKKVNSDLFLLILLIVRLGLQPDVHVNRWHLALESRSVFLGPTSAYTQTSPHIPYFSERYPHPKSLESNEIDEATILFSRLNYYDTLRTRESNLIACIANSPAENDIEQRLDSHDSDSSESGFSDHSLPSSPGTRPSLQTRTERDIPLCFDTVELSAEDMDLIEILWKQDIDLGVSREAYDSRPCLEVEKLKDIEIKKEKDIYNSPDTETNQETALVPDPFGGLNYTIDSETGEYLVDEFSRLGNIPDDQLENDAKFLENELLKENETLGALSHDSYMPFGEDDEFCDLSSVFSPSQLTNLLNDSDYLSQIEDLEKELEQFSTLNESSGSSPPAGEMYPNMEDCWPDSTTMLPLLALSSSHQPSIGPLSSHPYPGLNNNVSIPTPQSRPSESFIGMLQSASIEGPSTEEFQSISSGVCPSSIGCAVVESMATLANDTDPLPTSSIINSAYSSEFPEMIYSNHTVAVPHNELLADLLLDDDLPLGPLCASSQEKQNEDHMDTSSDSISLTSGQLPSVSDYESDSRCFSDIPFENGNCNDQQYFNFKYSDISESCVNAVSGNKISFSKKFDYNHVPKPSGVSSSNFMHHNHSYHLPFNTDDQTRPVLDKPVTRDKSKYSSEDDASNKDEKRAKELKLPISINDIINLAIDEYNERLSKYELTEAQLTLIRDIRRRGKNKVAAQNCRKRKMDQISSLQQDLNFLQREKLQLKSKQNHLLHEKLHFEDKYAQLYDYVLQSSNSKPPNPPNNIAAHRSGRGTLPINSELISEEDSDPNRSTRTKRKYKK